jgi:hypothetical protein
MAKYESYKLKFTFYKDGVDGKGVSIKGNAFAKETINDDSIDGTYILYDDAQYSS